MTRIFLFFFLSFMVIQAPLYARENTKDKAGSTKDPKKEVVEEKIKELQRQNQAIIEKNTILIETQNNLKEQLADLKIQSKKMVETLQLTTSDKQMYADKIASLEVKYREEIKRIEEQNGVVSQEEADFLRRHTVTQKERIDTLEKELEKNKEFGAKQQKILTEHKKLQDDFKKRLSVLSLEKEKVTEKHEKEKLIFKNKINDLEMKKRTYELEIQELKRGIRDINKNIKNKIFSENERLKKEVEFLETKIDAKDQAYEKLNMNFKGLVKEFDSFKRKQKAVQNSLKAEREGIQRSFDKEKAELEAKIRAAQQEVEEIDAAKKEYIIQLVTAKADFVQTNKRIVELEEQMQIQLKKNQEASIQIQSLNEQLKQDVKAREDALAGLKRKNEEELDNIKKDKLSLDQKYSDLAGKYERNKILLTEERAKHKKILDESTENLEIQLGQLKDQLSKERKKNKDQQKQLQEKIIRLEGTTIKQITDKEKRIKELATKITELEKTKVENEEILKTKQRKEILAKDKEVAGLKDAQAKEKKQYEKEINRLLLELKQAVKAKGISQKSIAANLFNIKELQKQIAKLKEEKTASLADKEKRIKELAEKIAESE